MKSTNNHINENRTDKIYKYAHINILLTQNNTIFFFFLPYNEIVR